MTPTFTPLPVHTIAASLPMHPLLVHIPVVLIPLAAIGVLAIAIRPRWMATFGWLVAGLAGVGFIGTLLAANTGEELMDTLRESGQRISSTLDDHAEMGDSAQAATGVFFLLVLAWVVFAWWRRRKGEEAATATVRKPRVIAGVLCAIAIVGGVLATASVTVTGHSGATSVWESKR
jgi:uncharacterized membrane protein